MWRQGIFILAGAVVWCSLTGCKATPPGVPETKAMDWAKLHITVGYKDVKNPVKFSAESLKEGQQAFGSYCFVCHGLDGQNTGVPFANRMSPPVPLLNSPQVQSYTDGQLKWVIENGISPSGMPASRGTLSDDEMWAIVVYLRHLPPAGSLGEPRAYSGEDATDAGDGKQESDSK
jgi:mono/diheme cytochrome c family protein